MNLLDGVPTQACQFCHILDRANTAKVNDKVFQRSGIMLFRLREGQVGLPDGPTIVAVEPWDINHQFDLAATDRKHLENPCLLTEPDDAADTALGRIVNKVFHGSRELVINRLVSDEDVSAEELRRIKENLERRLEELEQ